MFKATGLRAIANFLVHTSTVLQGPVHSRGRSSCRCTSSAVGPPRSPQRHGRLCHDHRLYVLVGLPSFTDICHDVAALKINTHVCADRMNP